VNEPTLFDMDAAPRPAPAEKLSADRRRTIRSAECIANGAHPLTLIAQPGRMLRLHPDAPRNREKEGTRCGRSSNGMTAATGSASGRTGRG
jgi:hypothetical protein